MTSLYVPEKHSRETTRKQLPTAVCSTNKLPPGVASLEHYRRGIALLDAAQLSDPHLRAPDAAELAALVDCDDGGAL